MTGGDHTGRRPFAFVAECGVGATVCAPWSRGDVALARPAVAAVERARYLPAMLVLPPSRTACRTA